MFFLTKNIPYANNLHMDNSTERKSCSCFPITNAIEAYVTIRKAHDILNRHASKKLAQWGLSVPKYGVLVNLYDKEPLLLSELSNLIFRGNSNMTTLINRMERDGLVERINEVEDRRSKRTRLTEKGRSLAPKIIAEYRAFLHQMMNRFSLEEQNLLINLLQRVKDFNP